jgi:hypothetical protein
MIDVGGRVVAQLRRKGAVGAQAHKPTWAEAIRVQQKHFRVRGCLLQLSMYLQHA